MRRLIALVVFLALILASMANSPGTYGIDVTGVFKLVAPVVDWFSNLTSAADPTESAIKGVIQRANQEQEQAFARSNPAIMQDTAAGAYYDQLVQTNAQLRNQGVTAIHLDALMWWGQVRLAAGNDQAQASTVEMWTTSYKDGTSDQSTDRNVYSLVRQGGAWKITADNHPGGIIPAPYPVQPLVPLPGSSPQSMNWAGYQASSGTVTAVSATWTVPRVSGASMSADATWVGIGGVKSTDLIQAGTEATVSGPGQIEYDGWIEMLPRTSEPIALTVHSQDSVTVSISASGPGQWRIAFKNNSTGQTYARTVTYRSSESSAEWIEEAPSSRRGLLPLDDFGTVRFTAASAIRDGRTNTISQAGGQAITMINAAGQVLASPSSLGGDGASFTVSRTSAVSTGGRPGARTVRRIRSLGFGLGRWQGLAEPR